MTPEQLVTLKAAIVADTDPAVVQALADRVDSEIARLYNLPASPQFFVWRRLVTQDEIMQNGFDWVRVDNLSVGKARIWEWLFRNALLAIDAQKENIRTGIMEVWKGTAPDLAVRQVVLNHCQKPATKVERLFSTGSGTSSSIDGTGPGLTTFHGPVSVSEVSQAINLP